MKNNVYEIVTNSIMESLENGVIPWRKPFSDSFNMLPINFSTGRAYRGINILLLGSIGYNLAYSHNSWLTFHQAKKIGGHIKKGEKASRIIFWKKVLLHDETESDSKKMVFIARIYHVFNIDQCEGLDYDKGSLIPESPISSADEVISAYPSPPEIQLGSHAVYFPELDVVKIPSSDKFISQEEYYATLFHELIHSTGHPSRLNRVLQGRLKAEQSYAEEELIAEIGSAFLCAMLEIDNSDIQQNKAAYIQGWLKALEDDKRLVVKAASQAQKAVDYILQNEFDRK